MHPPPDAAMHPPPDAAMHPPPDAAMHPPPDAAMHPPPDAAMHPPPDAAMHPPPDAAMHPPPDAAMHPPPDAAMHPPPDAAMHPPPDAAMHPPPKGPHNKLYFLQIQVHIRCPSPAQLYSHRPALKFRACCSTRFEITSTPATGSAPPDIHPSEGISTSLGPQPAEQRPLTKESQSPAHRPPHRYGATAGIQPGTEACDWLTAHLSNGT
ncbi:hypothetical protein GDO78_009033 [Eleutherodactylus coqui]|uniref:Uncharacterized protein n=1 Tax=Eleutherodactylus coqui TaxID=57060 RepID=A0A8J6FA30_ELECQ|nr:hypothetical protein GDO78_009033 [Eleutherodactylus coqui]